MKKALILLLAAAGFTASAQDLKPEWGEDSVKCRENLYIYYELAKGKAYLEAYDAWNYVYENCPGSSINNFIYGGRILDAKIEQAGKENPASLPFKKELINLYDKRLDYFPGKEGYVFSRKAIDMTQLFPDSNEAAYPIYKKALEYDKEQSAAFYNYYFVTAARLFNDDVFEIGDVFQAYNVVIEGIEFNTDALNRTRNELIAKDTTETLSQKEADELAKADRELERYDNVASNINKILAPIATCEKLQIIYNEESFAANKTDAVWLRRAAVMLTKDREDEEGNETDCTDNPIFFKVAEALYQQDPSAKAARAMASLSRKNNNYAKAADYLSEAIEGEVDPGKKANDLVKLASIQQKLGRLSSAKSSALQAASLRKNWGTPYIILATVYASGYGGACTGANVFENKAVYWAAIDKLKYARSIDPSSANRANRLINSYKAQLPDKTVLFQLGKKEGDKFSVGCYINETITVDYSI